MWAIEMSFTQYETVGPESVKALGSRVYRGYYMVAWRYEQPVLLTAETPFSRIHLAPVVQKVDNAIHPLNHYPGDSASQLLNKWGLA